MKALRIVLIIVGLLTLIFSAMGVFVPWETMISWAKSWNVQFRPAVESPITVYLFRVGCVTWAWAGVLFLVAAVNPVKYLALIRSLALACVCLGLTCILVGVKLDLPAKGYLIDGVFCLVAGGLIWALSTLGGQQHARLQAPPAEAAE